MQFSFVLIELEAEICDMAWHKSSESFAWHSRGAFSYRVIALWPTTTESTQFSFSFPQFAAINSWSITFNLRAIWINIKNLSHWQLHSNEILDQFWASFWVESIIMQSLAVRGATKSYRSEKKDHLILDKLNLTVDVGSMWVGDWNWK